VVGFAVLRLAAWWSRDYKSALRIEAGSRRQGCRGEQWNVEMLGGVVVRNNNIKRQTQGKRRVVGWEVGKGLAAPEDNLETLGITSGANPEIMQADQKWKRPSAE
jgi:hypothetical protein